MNRLQIFQTIWSEVGAGVFGLLTTLLGAAISWHASQSVYKRQLDDQPLTSAFALLAYLQVAHSKLLGLERHINDCKTRFDELPKTDLRRVQDLWVKISPVVGLQDMGHLDKNDLTFIMRAKEYELMDDIILVSMRLSGISEGMEKYALLRSQLSSKLCNEFTAGQVIGGVLDPDRDKHLYPLMLELNTLIESIIDLLNESLPTVERALNKFGPVSRRFFGSKKFPNIRVGVN